MTAPLRLLMAVLALVLPTTAHAQERVGVATTVVGPVTVTRVTMAPTALRFKDDVLLNDRIATGDGGFARVLLGGKAIVTARERSVVVITEQPGTSTIELTSGRISVAVDKAKMRAGELVEIKTSNAVAGVRGTIVVAEATGDVSRITVLRGVVDVYRRDPATGGAVGPATPVGLRESVTVRAGVLPLKAQSISPESARRLSGEFVPPVRAVSPTAGLVSDEMTKAKDLAGTLTPSTAARLEGAGPQGPRAAAPGEKNDKAGPLGEAALPKGPAPGPATVSTPALPSGNALPPVVALPGSGPGLAPATLPTTAPTHAPSIPILPNNLPLRPTTPK
jgi:hypothetical protein